MDTITFRFLISMAVSKRLETRLMDVVMAYLYGSLDFDIFMKIPERYKMSEAYTPRNLYLIKKGYKNDPICPCVFIKKSEIGFAIIAVYVDLNS